MLRRPAGKLIFAVLLFFAVVVLLPETANACACCSEPGTYYISTGKPQSFQIDLLKEMKFKNKAVLFMTEAGFDGMKGLQDIQSEYEAANEFDFGVTGAFSANSWKLNFKTAKGKTGALTLPMPTTMVNYVVDIRDGQTSAGGGPLLYKEWRFKGNFNNAAGFFKSGVMAPTTYFLVFQGRGNGCDNAEDFKHWRLEITGKKADYAFYGDMNVTEPTAKN